MPAPWLAGSAIAAGLIQGGITAGTSRRNTDATIRANREMAEYAYAKDLEQFERMKEYNAPTAQMARFKAAGLNPNLIYGQGTPGNVNSTPSYQAPRQDYKYAPPVDLPMTLAMYQDVAVKDAQIDNLQAQTENVEARTATELINKNLRGAQYKSQAARALVDVGYGQDLAQAELELKRQNLTNAQKDEIGKDLRNTFQEYANQWAKYGVTGKDALIIRSGIKIMQQLGIDHSWLLEMLPKGTTLDDVLKMN